MPAAKACHMAKRRVDEVLAVLCWARAPRGGVTRQGIVLTDLESLLSLSLSRLYLIGPCFQPSSLTSLGAVRFRDRDLLTFRDDLQVAWCADPTRPRVRILHTGRDAFHCGMRETFTFRH